MADDAVPISTTVPETVTIQTGADKETLGDLNKQFADFWGEEDSKAGTPPNEAPAAPALDGAGAAQETKPEKKPEPPPKPEPPKQTAPPPVQQPPSQDKRYTDEEVEKLGLPQRAGQPPEMQADFKQLKGLWQPIAPGSRLPNRPMPSYRPSLPKPNRTRSPPNRKLITNMPPLSGDGSTLSVTPSSS